MGVVRFQDRFGVFVSVCRVTENLLNSLLGTKSGVKGRWHFRLHAWDNWLGRF